MAERRSLFKIIFGNKNQDNQQAQRLELINSTNSTFYTWNKRLYDNDIVRAAVRPTADAVGKLNAKHIVGFDENKKINPTPYIRELLEQPNPYMSMQDFLTKMVYQRESGNAFAYVQRSEDGYPTAIYPIPYSSVELLEKNEEIFIKFLFLTGKYMVVPYVDMIHLRKDFNEHDFFGDSNVTALKNIMEVITITDQGMVTAIKNSAVLKWIMKFTNITRPEDKEEKIKDFVKNYLSITNQSGVVVQEPTYELQQVDEKNYVPNAVQMRESIQRLYSFFGVNENIVQNKYNEDEWNAFYESKIEPIAIQLSNAFTRAFFSARERGYGNKIIFEASNLQYASMSTKLQLVQMVDRAALTRNEWRKILNLSPLAGGDEPILRLDTAPVGNSKNNKEGSNDNQG